MEDLLGLDENAMNKYVEMKDDIFSNMYDNYESLATRGDSDFYSYGGYNRGGGYFGSNGIYN